MAARIRSGKRLLFGFHPGAGKPPNRWPTERFVELINLLLEMHDGAAFVTAGPMDEEVIDILLNSAKQSIELVENKNIRTVASIIKEANLYISNDTGLLHVAAGVGTPLVGLFGPTDPLQWAPRGENIRSIQGKGGSIAEIQVEQVFRCANELLEKADR
jgi:ADP-heptose:LPS heptosyltransferase